MIAWILLAIAGLCEVVWALGLKYTDGFTKLMPSVITIVFMIISVYLLAVAAKTIPIGISYTVWVGIGAVGAFIGGVFLIGDKVNVYQVVSLALIIAGIAGMKIASN